MHLRLTFFCVLFYALITPMPAMAKEISMEQFFPVPACAEGWILDGKVALFDKDTLFDRIDGESELFFPYGFQKLAYARYENRQDPRVALDIDVYRMGSLIDAFGMFANYRRKDDEDLRIGSEGTISSSQVFFYQDQYFVRLQVTGAVSAPLAVLKDCARAISQNLPQTSARPTELEAFLIPAVVKKSERYVAQSLLGYDFFRRGLIAEARVKGETIQVFVVLESSHDAARKALDQYRSYLTTSGKDIRSNDTGSQVLLEAIDPLYDNMFAEAVGRFVIGAVRIKDMAATKELVEQLRLRLGVR
jgi:hypothetical protein